jgi:hypothetical protein
MKKQNQAPTKDGKTTQNSRQQKARAGLMEIAVPMTGTLRRAVERGAKKLNISPSRFVEQAIREVLPVVTAQHAAQQNFEILISQRRSSLLHDLAKKIQIDPVLIGTNAIKSYLACVEEYPHLAEAQCRFVRTDALFTLSPDPQLAVSISEACEIYDLDRNSLADTAIGLWIDAALSDDSMFRAASLESKGEMDPHQIAYRLGKLSEGADMMFGKLVQQISAQPFYQACGDFLALRGLVSHHPSLKTEREALEMIVEGANRLT